jgi:hypothetical protein
MAEALVKEHRKPPKDPELKAGSFLKGLRDTLANQYPSANIQIDNRTGGLAVISGSMIGAGR